VENQTSHKTMFNTQTEAVLSLTAFAIFADKRVLSEEINKFISFADILEVTNISDIKITEAKLLHWFEMNKSDLQKKMEIGHEGLSDWLNLVLDDLDGFKRKDLILEWINDIACADGEHHISEKALFAIVEDRLGEAA